jgi:hypothetical protein
MTNPDFFCQRAASYRQLAQDSEDQDRAGDLFEVAALFDAMAADLDLLNRAKREKFAVGHSGNPAGAAPQRWGKLFQMAVDFVF